MRKLWIRLLLLALAAVYLIPFLFLVTSSLAPEGTALERPLSLPGSPRWSNYAEALEKLGAFDEESPLRGFLRLLFNTTLLTLLSILFQLITCSMAGYAFARLRFRGKGLLFVVVLATLMLPMPVTVIPQFVLYRELGWIDTFLPLLAPCLLGGSPFFIFLFRQFFLTIPRDLVEAARLDGCGWTGVFLRVFVPLSTPVAAAVAIFTFLSVWNEIWLPLIYLSSPEKGTLTLALAGFSRSYRVNIELLMAASTVALLPCLLVYAVFQRKFLQGIQLSAGKG
jgi:multiple sugar transport system permease protein